MKTIWKFKLPIGDEVTILMPEGAQVLSVQTQDGVPCVWAIVDHDAPEIERYFSVRGTGHRADAGESMRFVGTFQMHGGALVFHLFEPLALFGKARN